MFSCGPLFYGAICYTRPNYYGNVGWISYLNVDVGELQGPQCICLSKWCKLYCNTTSGCMFETWEFKMENKDHIDWTGVSLFDGFSVDKVQLKFSKLCYLQLFIFKCDTFT